VKRISRKYPVESFIVLAKRRISNSQFVQRKSSQWFPYMRTGGKWTFKEATGFSCDGNKGRAKMKSSILTPKIQIRPDS
jgi:hypothetical protein